MIDEPTDEPVAREYPIETSQLDKGSRITVEEIEEAFNVARTSSRYRLVCLRLRKYIEWRLAERGLEVMTRIHRDDIVVLTDSQASLFSDSQFKNALRMLGRMLGKQMSVDRAPLSDLERARHDRALGVNGRTLAGARRERQKALVPTPRPRLTPGGEGRK